MEKQLLTRVIEDNLVQLRLEARDDEPGGDGMAEAEARLLSNLAVLIAASQIGDPFVYCAELLGRLDEIRLQAGADLQLLDPEMVREDLGSDRFTYLHLHHGEVYASQAVVKSSRPAYLDEPKATAPLPEVAEWPPRTVYHPEPEPKAVPSKAWLRDSLRSVLEESIQDGVLVENFTVLVQRLETAALQHHADPVKIAENLPNEAGKTPSIMEFARRLVAMPEGLQHQFEQSGPVTAIMWEPLSATFRLVMGCGVEWYFNQWDATPNRAIRFSDSDLERNL